MCDVCLVTVSKELWLSYFAFSMSVVTFISIWTSACFSKALAQHSLKFIHISLEFINTMSKITFISHIAGTSHLKLLAKFSFLKIGRFSEFNFSVSIATLVSFLALHPVFNSWTEFCLVECTYSQFMLAQLILSTSFLEIIIIASREVSWWTSMEIMVIIIKSIIVKVSERPVISSLVIAIPEHTLTISSRATSHPIIFADRFSYTDWHSIVHGRHLHRGQIFSSIVIVVPVERWRIVSSIIKSSWRWAI